MIQIGKLTLDAPFFQAGLAGYSDSAMRLIARKHGCPFCITEAMLDTILLNGGKGLSAAELEEADHPIAGQIMGSEPAEMARAAKLLVGMGYDVIDVNFGCPVRKIRRKFRGGHLLQEPDTAIAILDAVRQAVPSEIPCTVKLRRGTDDSLEAERRFHEIFQAVLRLGYAGATVHGRTVEQKYLGPARWGFLANLVTEYGLGRKVESGEWRVEKEKPTDDAHLSTSHFPLPTFTLFGSGDIWSAGDISRMIRETGVHGVSVARGCIGNPWIFTQARAFMAGQSPVPPTIAQQRQVLLEHFELSVNLYGPNRAGVMMRKFGIKFSRHHLRKDEVAKAFIGVHTLDDWRGVLDEHYTQDGPGMSDGSSAVQVQDLDSCEAAELSAA